MVPSSSATASHASPRARLHVSVQKDAPVSIKEQLITQISLQIAAGHLTPGSRLPSVRALSKQLDIHYNTCLGVYKALAELGMVEAHRGSGMRVRHRENVPVPASAPAGEISLAVSQEAAPASLQGKPVQNALTLLAAQVVQLAKRQGYPYDLFMLALKQEWEGHASLQPQPALFAAQAFPQSVTYVDRFEDMLPVFQAELAQGLPWPARRQLLDTLTPETMDPTTLYVTSRYYVDTLMAKLPSARQVYQVEVSSGIEAVPFLKTLTPEAVVSVVSVSETLHQMARTMIYSHCGSQPLVLWVDAVPDTAANASPVPNTKAASLLKSFQQSRRIWVDAVLAPALEGFFQYHGCAGLWQKVEPLRLIPESEIQALHEHGQRLNENT